MQTYELFFKSANFLATIYLLLDVNCQSDTYLAYRWYIYEGFFNG